MAYGPVNVPGGSSGRGVFYGTCDTDDSTLAVTLVDSTGFELEAGVVVLVKFAEEHDNGVTLTLNVDGTGAVPVEFCEDTLDLEDENGLNFLWAAGELVLFVFDGASWVMEKNAAATEDTFGMTKLDNSYANANTYRAATPYAVNAAYTKASEEATAAAMKAVYGTCGTAAATAAKTVTLSGFTLQTGARIAVCFTYGNTAASPTLNVNSTGAKAIRRLSSTAAMAYMWQAGEVVEFVYSGSYWYMVNAGLATTTYYGRTKLTDSVTSEDTSTAATPNSVKTAYDKAVDALDKAEENALPTGGTEGQVLTKTSDTDGDVTWEDMPTGKVFYGTCGTAATTDVKVVTLVNDTGFSLTAGTMIVVRFGSSCGYATSLNVNGTGTKGIFGAPYVGVTWQGGDILSFVYNGTFWCCASTMGIRSYNRIQTGTYTGTGTFGSANPNSITFADGWKPLAIFITCESSAYLTQGPWFYGVTAPYVNGAGTNYVVTAIWTTTETEDFDGTFTLSWYQTGNAARQLNTSGATYNWIAFGDFSF